jgi:class 3 adenylate cyclase
VQAIVTSVSSSIERPFVSLDVIASPNTCFHAAVAGLPVPRADHATVMATFAKACLRSFTDLSKRLEVVLGPGTGSLALRVGLHSGPVTAGVLRGDNARFQLFGDVSNVDALSFQPGVGC